MFSEETAIFIVSGEATVLKQNHLQHGCVTLRDPGGLCPTESSRVGTVQ